MPRLRVSPPRSRERVRRVVRSRSRTPVRGKAPIPSKPSLSTVNELDRIALQKVNSESRGNLKNRITGFGGGGFKPRENITCTIDNGARPTGTNVRFNSSGGFDRNRISGGRFVQSGPTSRGFGDRSDNFDRNSRGFGMRNDRDAPPRRTREREAEEEDPNKPVMKLQDPAVVPKGRYFDHDDRERDVWRGKAMYDPRKDFGFGPEKRMERERRGGGWSGFGGGGGQRRSFGGGDRFHSGGGGGRGGFGGFRSNSGADGVWTHDKYIELEGGEEEDEDEKNVKIEEGVKKETDEKSDQPRRESNKDKEKKRKHSSSRSRSRSRSRSLRVRERRFREEKTTTERKRNDSHKKASRSPERRTRRRSRS